MEGREKLKKSIEDMYGNTIIYNEVMYKRLNDRIDKEVNSDSSFYIYTSAEEISKVDPIDEFLKPIISSDLEIENYNLAEINYNIRNGHHFILTSIFMECDFITFNEIIKNKKSYKGEIKTDISIYEINFYIERSTKYIDEIENLYHIFRSNGVKWRTINCPFVYKYIDLVVKEELAIEGDIQEIRINLDEYESYKRANFIPLWNISKSKLKNVSNYMPAIDRLIFEHEIKLDSSINGYLLASHNDDYLYHRRQKDEFIMVTSRNTEEELDILRVNNPSNFRKNRYAYEVLSNKNLYKAKPVIRNKSEVFEFINSYDYLKLSEIEILETYKKIEQTQNLNKFLDNNVRSDEHKRIMLLIFESNTKNFLTYDKMSFLISEIQLFFPEYRTIGELI